MKIENCCDFFVSSVRSFRNPRQLEIQSESHRLNPNAHWPTIPTRCNRDVLQTGTFFHRNSVRSGLREDKQDCHTIRKNLFKLYLHIQSIWTYHYIFNRFNPFFILGYPRIPHQTKQGLDSGGIWKDRQSKRIWSEAISSRAMRFHANIFWGTHRKESKTPDC